MRKPTREEGRSRSFAKVIKKKKPASKDRLFIARKQLV
jgi:hypothetical protein